VFPESAGGESYAGIIHVDGRSVVLPFAEVCVLPGPDDRPRRRAPPHIQAPGPGINGNASLIISNMAAEPDCGPNTNLRNTSVAAWEAALDTALAGWPNARAFSSSVSQAYSLEASVDPAACI